MGGGSSTIVEEKRQERNIICHCLLWEGRGGEGRGDYLSFWLAGKGFAFRGRDG